MCLKLEWMLYICSICSPNLELLINPPLLTHPILGTEAVGLCGGGGGRWVPSTLTSSWHEESHFLLEAFWNHLHLHCGFGAYPGSL